MKYLRIVLAFQIVSEFLLEMSIGNGKIWPFQAQVQLFKRIFMTFDFFTSCCFRDFLRFHFYVSCFSWVSYKQSNNRCLRVRVIAGLSLGFKSLREKPPPGEPSQILPMTLSPRLCVHQDFIIRKYCIILDDVWTFSYDNSKSLASTVMSYFQERVCGAICESTVLLVEMSNSSDERFTTL